ncbi:restriction endonuclease subunit S [Vibrio aestuarianus]|uniref:restriction endonuclease subunit S n=1 Tax=Vibrio aestuarianus TaxID=28171 RepID=UPI0015595C0B|nr:restriction endonuclease subunit S [Vibrio aestuarianus]NGZ14981.1 restriction endonuclease subunit S [Vibrio aestuarianus]NKZ51129.1 restriction endonuclease subunit S [Vibrio aestuarianus]
MDHKQGYYTTEAYVDDGIKLLRITDLCGDGLIDFSQCPKVPKEDPTLVNYKLENGDVVFARTGGAGSFGVVSNISENVVFASYLIRFRFCNDSFEANYLKYVLLADSFQKAVKQNVHGGVNQNIHAEDIKGTYLARPPKEQQQKIASFLDHETAKIDTLITKQEKLIELLKEKRQAVISHAVTKGLNPDAPMKDSGVEWLGEVPEHWAVLPTKRFFRLVAEPSPKNHDKELLSVYAAIGVAPRKELEQKGNKASNTDGYWLVKKGDIIVNKLLAWMGAVGYSEYNGVTSPAYDILRKTKDINPKFYHYLFRQEFTQKEFKRWSRGIMEMRLRLYFEELGRIMMPMPPKNEQDAIVDEIESMDSKFSQVEEKSKLQIELLKERKTALISAAVTGKIDVRDWEPK